MLDLDTEPRTPGWAKVTFFSDYWRQDRSPILVSGVDRAEDLKLFDLRS